MNIEVNIILLVVLIIFAIPTVWRLWMWWSKMIGESLREFME
jgi:hypothetical protein